MARKQKHKKLRYRVAIVGEGPTEWHYFNDLKQTERYSYTLKPELAKHSDYQAIFDKAVQLASEGYDQVYCVLDVDVMNAKKKEQIRYLQAKRKVEKQQSIIVFETMPCFEYWFLLHFTNYSTKIYPTYKSLEIALKKYLPDYEKTNDYFKKVKIYQTLRRTGNLEKAMLIAEKLRREKAENDNSLFPFSEVDLVLNALKDANKTQ